MTVRKSSVLWLILGTLLVIAAVVIRFVVLPSMSKLPDDLSQSQKYEGTMQALNAQAFASNDLANLLSPEMPITADRSLTVDAVDGDTAIVTSKAVISLPDKTEQNDVHTYAVSRVDYSPVEISPEQQQSLVPKDKQATFEPHDGIAFSWPMNPPQGGTAMYDSVTQTAQTASFEGEGDVDGRAVNNYVVDAQGPIKNPGVLGQFKDFPAQLPKQLIQGLLQAGIVPAEYRGAVEAALPSLPMLVPISFESTNDVKAAVDQQFGAPIKVEQTQGMYVTIPINDGQTPVLPLSIVNLRTADSEVTATADTLATNSTLLSLIGVWLPLVLFIIGLALVILGGVRLRKPTATTE